jgi:hypothetical protein
VDDEQAAVACSAGRLAGIAFYSHHPRHHVFRHSRAGMTIDLDFSLLVHAAAVEANMPVDFNGQWQIQAARDRMFTHRVPYYPAPLVRVLRQGMQPLVEGANAILLQIEFDHACPQV